MGAAGSCSCGSLPGQGDSAGHKHKCWMLRSCKRCSWAATQHRCLLIENRAFWYLPEIFLFVWRHSPVFLSPTPRFRRFFSRPFKLTACEQRCSRWTKSRGLMKGLLPTGTHTRAELSRAGSGPAKSMFRTRVAMATEDELMWRNWHTEQRARCGCGGCTWPCWRQHKFTPVCYPHVAARLPAVPLKAWPSNSIWARRLGCATSASAPWLPASPCAGWSVRACTLHFSPPWMLELKFGGREGRLPGVGCPELEA